MAELDTAMLELVANHWDSLSWACVPSTGGPASFEEVYLDEPQRVPSWLGDLFAHALVARGVLTGVGSNDDRIAAAQATARALFALDFPGYANGTVQDMAHFVGEIV